MSKANPRFHRTNTPPVQATNNIYRVRVYGTIEGQMTINTWYYIDGNTIGTLVPFLTVGTAWQTAFLPHYTGALSADWSGTKVTIDSPNNPTVAPAVQSLATTGGGPAGHEPTEVAVVILRNSALKGQCGRGRIGIPAVPTGWVTASKLTNVTAHGLVANDIGTGFTAGTQTMVAVVFSRGTKSTPRLGASPVTSGTLTVLLGTIRRRKIGRGK